MFLCKNICRLKRLLSPVVIFSFIASFIAQSSFIYAAQGSLLNLPEPGEMISLSQKFVPAYVKGIFIYPNDPFKFDFIIDTGDTKLSDQKFKDESNKLIKYFMAALTVPEKEDWVNLSPYEKDRIIPESLGVTEMGRDMLAQDYILKQLTSSLIYPEREIGKEFWGKVYAQAQKQFGTTDIPMNTFNKVWIVPSQAVVWEHGNSAYVVRSHLKVMLEQDYLSLNKHLNNNIFSASGMDRQDAKTASAVASNVVREVVLPALEKEVNEGASFATLRQVFNSMILATWYKQNLKQSILGQVYVNKNKVTGIDVTDRQIKQKIYHRYLQAFKKGAYNYIKEDADPATHQPVARKYFSGGTDFKDLATIVPDEKLRSEFPPADLAQTAGKTRRVTALLQTTVLAANGVTNSAEVKRGKKYALLTGGGEATGHNKVLAEAVRYAEAQGVGIEMWGIPKGWAGVVDPDLKKKIRRLTIGEVERFENHGGTIIKSTRTNPLAVSDKEIQNELIRLGHKDPDAVSAAVREEARLALVKRKVGSLVSTLKGLNIDGLIVMGGDDTNGVSSVIHSFYPDFPILGLPKTMDDDVYLPEGAHTYGADSYITAAAKNLSNLMVTATGLDRIVVVETFGRDAGFTSIASGARAGTTLTLIPEQGKIYIGKELCITAKDIDKLVEKVREFYIKNHYALIVVSEGVKFEEVERKKIKNAGKKRKADPFGHEKKEGAAEAFVVILKARLKDIEGLIVTHAEKLGYATREAPISPVDAMITRALGLAAVRFLEAGKTGKILYTDENFRAKPMSFPDEKGVVAYFDNKGIERTMNISQLRGDGPEVSAEDRRKIGGRIAHIEEGGSDYDTYVAANEAIFGEESRKMRIELELNRIDKEMVLDIVKMSHLFNFNKELKQLGFDIQDLNEGPVKDRLAERVSEIKIRLSELIKIRAGQIALGEVDEAQLSQVDQAPVVKMTPEGGINLDAAMLDLQIKRDGKGIPLPISQQPFKDADIHGLRPVIIRDVPIDLPLLLGVNTQQKAG